MVLMIWVDQVGVHFRKVATVKKALIGVFVLACGVMVGGCNSNESTATETKAGVTPQKASVQPTTNPVAPVVAAPSKYDEIKVGNVIYVVGSAASADKVRAGQKLGQFVSAFGYGPNGEKVIFETDKEGKLEKTLMAEFATRHPK
jgi:hypothetical protein